MGRSVFSIYCKVKMLRSFSIEILIVIVAFGSTNGMKWWKSTLAETNEIVKEIQGSLSFSNCNGNETEPCAGPGYEIALCGAATQYCPECEAKYCIYDNGSYYQEFYNPVTGYELFIYTYDYEYYDYDYCDTYYEVYDPSSSYYLLYGYVEATEVSGYIRGNRKDAKNELPSKNERNAKK